LKGVLSQLGVTCASQGKALDLGILPDRQQLLLETRSSVGGRGAVQEAHPQSGLLAVGRYYKYFLIST
jgi:hypothetical protein